MKITITGGAGYIGCKLSEQLLNQGHHVVCVDWLKWGIEPILNIVDHPNFELHNVDICTPEVETLIKTSDSVIHLAGIIGFPACNAQPDLAYRINVEGTKRVIDASAGKKFVYASTGSVYGELNSVCTEEVDANPLSTYAEYKLKGEEYLAGSNAVILRPATAFGVSNRLRNDLLINDFTKRAIFDNKLELFEGHFKRTFLSVNDLARAFNWGVTRFDQMKGQVWNVGDDRLNLTKLDIAKIIQNKYDYELIENTTISHDQDARNYFVDYTKISKLGFAANESVEQGIDNLIKVYSNLAQQHRYR
jgi:nucleoside-diphosphate-sugar epimerase